ncbi:ABC transporter substrate-binding protein [Gemmatimonadota bacterium]
MSSASHHRWPTLLLGCFLLLGACGEEQRILRVAESPWEDSLYPVETDNVASGTIGAQIYETLFRAYPDGSISPQLATGFECSPDGTQIRIRLRRGVRFHDGSLMDADAVAACLRLAADRAVGSLYSKAALYGFPQSFEAEDDSTVVIRLPAPHNALQRTLSALDHAAIARLDPPPPDGSLRVPPGTGPFRFRYVDDREGTLRLDAFDGYWGEAPLANGILVTAFVESDDAVAALRSGDIDIIFNATVGDDRPPETSSDPLVVRGPRAGYTVLGLNNGRSPFSDRSARIAFREMVDVETLVQSALKNLASETDQFIGQGLYPILEATDPPSLTPEALDQAIRDHFRTLRRPLKFIRPPGSSPDRDHWISQELRAQLRPYGVEVELAISSSWAAFDLALNEGDWDISDDGITTESHDLFEVLHLLYGFESEPGHYGLFLHTDSSIPRLLDRARTAVDSVAGRSLYQTCLDRITQLMPCLPFGVHGIYVLRSPDVMPFEWNGPHNLLLSAVGRRSWK